VTDRAIPKATGLRVDYPYLPLSQTPAVVKLANFTAAKYVKPSGDGPAGIRSSARLFCRTPRFSGGATAPSAASAGWAVHRARCWVPGMGVMKIALSGASISAVCQTPAGLIIVLPGPTGVLRSSFPIC
jgi:hypothetical protein